MGVDGLDRGEKVDVGFPSFRTGKCKCTVVPLHIRHNRPAMRCTALAIKRMNPFFDSWRAGPRGGYHPVLQSPSSSAVKRE